MTERACRALAERDLPGEPRAYDAISKRSNVPISTLRHRALGRPSIEAKARGQLYLKALEEEALVKHLILEVDLGNPVPIKKQNFAKLAQADIRRTPVSYACEHPSDGSKSRRDRLSLLL